MTATAVRHRNDVVLVGRLAAAPTVRALPSGDVVSTWRLVVDREDAPPRRRGRAVDALECATFAGGPREAVERCQAGDIVEVRGALRRRFWRGPSGVASRCEVEVAAARCLRSSRGGAGPVPCPTGVDPSAR